MIAIGKPYVSGFLLESIQYNNFPVISTREARELIGAQPLNWISEDEANSLLRQNPLTKIYTNSENTQGWLENHAASTLLLSKIQVFKNKIKFREILSDSYPDLCFRGVQFKDLENLDMKNLRFPLIIKPAVGFFSVAVYRIEGPNEWDQIVTNIKTEVEKWKDTYPKEVINTTDFIIEDCIDGEEFAIDCYFDQLGKPVILNILHHAFSSGKDVSDRVYSTSESILNKHYKGIQNFLNLIGDKIQLFNFPAHVEIRIDPTGRVVPIEVNPLRFGGWCTTADLTWLAYGINSYEYFFKTKYPRWDEVFKSRQGKKYSVVVLDNNSGINEADIESFDYNLLLKEFHKPLELRKTDFNKYAVFGFLFVETTEDEEYQLNRILTSDLREYIKLRKVK